MSFKHWFHHWIKVSTIFICGSLISVFSVAYGQDDQLTQLSVPALEDFDVEWQEISGITTNFPSLRRDGKVDFALVTTVFSRSDILSFELSRLISPQTDPLRVLGRQFDLPSNISLPSQQETYIFPVTLDKPRYRFYHRGHEAVRVLATHAQFPLGRVVDQLRSGASIFDVINDFTFIGGGWQDVPAGGPYTDVNIAVNQMPLDRSVHLTMPTLPSDQMAFGVSLLEKPEGFSPTDFKRFQSGGSMELKASASGTIFKLGVLTPAQQSLANHPRPTPANPAEAMETVLEILEESSRTPSLKQMSLSLQSEVDSRALTFLPLVAEPQVLPDRYLFAPPSLPADLAALGTVVILSEVEVIQSGSVRSERKNRLHEWTSPHHISEISAEGFSFERKPNRIYRLEVSYLAKEQSPTLPTTTNATLDLNEVTHVTRNSVDL